MAIDTNITDEAQGHVAKVTKRGQLVVAPLEFSEAYFQNLDVVLTAYNFAGPVTGKRFVITSITASGNKFIGTDGALVEIYEADAEDSLISTKDIYGLPIPKNGQLAITPLNLVINEGVFLNASVDDDDVYLTITGYYIDS